MASSSGVGLSGSKRSRREISEDKKAARMLVIEKLQKTKVPKWPTSEYSKFRQRYPYRVPKEEGIDAHFWMYIQEKIYDDCYYGKAYLVAPMHTINIAHMDKNAEYFAEAKAVCEQLGLLKLMQFNHEYNEDVICQFFATVHFGADDDKTMTWMTEGKQMTGTWAQFAECLGYPVLERDTEGYFRVHLSDKPIEKELLAPLYMPGNVVLGDIKFLQPLYDILVRIFREVLNPKVGCQSQIYGFLQNLLVCTHENLETGNQLDVMDYIWNELWIGIISRKAPVYAPYLMKFICLRWKDMGFGELLLDVHTLPHKSRDLKVKDHPAPPRGPPAKAKGKGKKADGAPETDDEPSVEASPMADPPKGWFARLQAQLAKSFCLKVDINKRQYQAHKNRKLEKRDRKLIMQKLKIPTWENGSEEVITSEEEWISKHCMSEQEFAVLGMPGSSTSQPVDAEDDEEDDGDESSEPEESDED